MSDSDLWIPVNAPHVNADQIGRVIDALLSTHLAQGPEIEEFEQRVAANVNRRYGIAVSSGSAALELAIEALRLSPGDEVILPTLTIVSCLAPLIRRNLVPVFVDSDPTTWNMDVQQIEGEITPRTRAILVPHLYGLPVDMNAVSEIANRHHLRVIEDAAQMHGQTCWRLPCGNFGDISTFSFYANKLVTTGEGGMVLTDDPELAQRCDQLRNLGMSTNTRRFVARDFGWNFRLSALAAALGLTQLDSVPERVLKKRELGAHYTVLLSGVPGLQVPLPWTDYAANIYWAYGLVLLNQTITAAQMIRSLERREIEARPFFYPLHRQPALLRYNPSYKDDRFPVAERLAEQGFYIPSGVGLTVAQRIRVAEAVTESLHENQ